MLFTVCFFVHVSHCMSSVSLSVGVVIVEASELSAESDGDLCETGEMNSFSTVCSSCFTVFPAVQQKRNYLASFSSRLRRFSLSSKVLQRLLSVCPRVRSEDEGEFPRDSHKRPEGVWDTQLSLHSAPETISLRATCPHPAFLQAVKRTRCFNQTQKASCSFTGEPKGFMYRSKLNTIQVTH